MASRYTAHEVGEEAPFSYNQLDVKVPKKKMLWILIGALIGVLISVLIIMIALAIALGVEQSKPTSTVCLTEGCTQASAQILASLNMSADPCDDFYEFACGKWIKSNVIPNGYGTITATLWEPLETNTIALRKILEGGGDGEVEAVRKAMDLYQSCIDTDRVNNLGAQPLRNLILETGGWSLVGVNESDPLWGLNSTHFRNELFSGSDAVFAFDFQFNRKNSSRYQLVIYQAETTLPPQLFNNSNVTVALRDFIVTVLLLIEPVQNNSTYETVANEIVEFERNLSFILEDVNAEPDTATVLNEISIKEVQTLFPHLDWTTFIQALYALANGSYMVTGGEHVFVATPNYLSNLTGLLSRLPNPDVLKHYAKWHLIKKHLPYLSANFQAALEEFSTTITKEAGSGLTKGLKLSQTNDIVRCINFVQEVMPIALAQPFVKQVLPEGTKEKLSVVVENVLVAFKQHLQRNDWLDDTSRQRSLEKVDAITRMIAYPDEIVNNSYVNGLYAELDIDSGDYFGNNRRQIKHSIRASVRRLLRGVDKTKWPIELAMPTDINAFYSASLNQIVILSGILSAHNFNTEWPEYVNIGAIGSIIGHEITHGFDNQGQRYDKDGILRQWWSEDSVQEFVKRQHCFVVQYNNYTNLGFKVNGTRTLAENIADNGGLNAAFQAHRNRLAAQGGKIQSLPSLDYSLDQIFFISFAQLWCSLYNKETAKQLILTDEHSPGRARVIGPVVNNPDFAEVFNCRVGSPMNPPKSEKCFLW